MLPNEIVKQYTEINTSIYSTAPCMQQWVEFVKYWE